MNVNGQIPEGEAKPIEIVRWLDSETHGNSWIPRGEFDEVAAEPLEPIVSVGFVWHESEDHIVLVQSVGVWCASEHIKIPKVAILGRDPLGSAVVPDGRQ